MEFPCGSIPFLSAKGNCSLQVTRWDSAKINQLCPNGRDEMRSIIDEMGTLSAKAQSLRNRITDYERIKLCSQRLYLLTICTTDKPETVVMKGFIKVGFKNLFIANQRGDIREISPLCVLDFYVHKSCQRYDKPSPKLLSFLQKHYCLRKYVPQANQFVVFDAYFESGAGSGTTWNSQGKVAKQSNNSNVGWICPYSFLKETIQKEKPALESRHEHRDGFQQNLDTPEVRETSPEKAGLDAGCDPNTGKLCNNGSTSSSKGNSALPSTDETNVMRNHEKDDVKNRLRPASVSSSNHLRISKSRYYAELAGIGTARALGFADYFEKEVTPSEIKSPKP